MLEFTKVNKSASVAWMAAGAAWFVVGAVYGLLGAIHLMAPDLLSNIPFLVFGRTRPAHVNTVIFGFVASILWGSALYIVPALLKTRLWSERMGWAAWVVWQGVVVGGEVCFAFGISQGREYGEYPWILDVMLTAAVVLLAFNLVMTVVQRQENQLYVSVWYVLGGTIATMGNYPIGNVMWSPAHGAMPGLLDSVFLWFYAHNLVGLLLTPLALAVTYYVVPRIVQRPLFSHTLSLIGFWALIALYTHIGGHHILQAPIPHWLRTVSVVDSMATIIPVSTVLANIWLTPRGRGGRLWADPAGRWVITGTIWYLLVCTQGPLQSLPTVQRVTHFTNWVVAHAHIGVLGFAGFIALGALWHVLPLACGRRLYSARLAWAQWALVLLGLTGFFLVLTIAGLIQGQAWENGATVYRVLPEISIYMVLRAVMGVFLLSGALVGLINVIMTLKSGQKPDDAGAQEATV